MAGSIESDGEVTTTAADAQVPPRPPLWIARIAQRIGVLVWHLAMLRGARLKLLPPRLRAAVQACGLAPGRLDVELRRIRLFRQWPHAWRRLGDEAAAAGAHADACRRYLIAMSPMMKRTRLRERLWASARREHRLARTAAGIRLDEVSIPGPEGKLVGCLEWPQSDASMLRSADGLLPVVAVFTGIGVVVEDLDHVADPLLAAGIAVCRIDVPGWGASEGPLTVQTSRMGVNVVEWLANVPGIDPARIHVFGTCLGGGVAYRAAATPHVASLHTVGAPFQLAGDVHYWPYAIRRQTHAVLRSRTWRGAARELQQLTADNEVAASRIEIPSFIHAGAVDSMVPVADTRALVEAIGPSARLVVHAGEGHGCPRRLDEIIRQLIRAVDEHVNRHVNASTK